MGIKIEFYIYYSSGMHPNKEWFLCLFIRLQDSIQHAQNFNVFSTHFSLYELFQILHSFTNTPPSFQR